MSTSELERGLAHLQEFAPNAVLNGVKALRTNGDLNLRIDFSEKTLAYKHKSDFFRGLGVLARGGEGVITETAAIEKLTAMVDLSRNAVYTVGEMKRFLCRLALIGYNGCMMYMEDTYEVPEYPYFGYQRGRYSLDELRELDAFADDLGIELMPCIQTLAHLRKTMRWADAHGIHGDNKEILLVGDPATYDFLDAMLKNLASAFKTKNIHIGMDEAWGLGRGEYLTLHGHKSKFEIMREHLDKVYAITEKYGLKPMIWDDMLFSGEGGSSVNYGDLYYADDDGLTPEQVASLPKNLTFVYWDYYHHEQEHYERQFARRANAPMVFAGGIWKWNGYVANNSKSFDMAKAAFAACVSRGVGTVINTLWGDDGAEAPLMSVLPGLAFWGELRFGHGDKDGVSRLCETIFGAPLRDFETLELLDCLPGMTLPNIHAYNPSKQLLYCDVGTGLLDRHYAKEEISEHYGMVGAKIGEIVKRMEGNDEAHDFFLMYQRLAELLTVKSPLNGKLRKAYAEQTLHSVRGDLSRCAELADRFNEALVRVWSKSAKPNGLEILNVRIGGIAARCGVLAQRIDMFLAGELKELTELTAGPLPYNGEDAGQYLFNMQYRDIFSANGYMHNLA